MADYSLGTAHGTVVIDSDTSGVDQANRSLDSVRKSAGNVGQAADNLSNKMGLAGIGIAGGLGVALKTAGDFEAELSGIKAVSGATASQMGALHDKALQIGKDTAFGASEAAQAMSELAKAGIPVPDILNGAADATVALAAATGVDMPTAATIASNAMNIFGIKAADMGGVVNAMSQAANASAIDVTDLGQSMQQVGAVAHLTGLSFQDTIVAIGEMGDQGIRGSDAGTSLKTMLQNLQPSTKTAAAAMKDLGLITKDGTNQFFDQNGKLKSLRDIQAILQSSTKNLTAAQKSQAFQTIFGSDAIRAAAVLAGDGAKGFDEFGKKMAGSGTAADQAKIRMDNMKGSLEQMKGSLETAAISIGEALIPYVKDLANWLGKLFDWFNNLDPGVKNIIVAVLAGAAAFLLMGSAVIKVVRGFQNIFGSISTLISWIFRKNAAEAESAAVSEGSALRSAAAWTASAVKTVAQWLWMGLQATAHAAVVAAAWLGQAVAAGVTMAAQWVANAAKTIAQWVLMGAQAALNAAKVAAAWLVTNGVAMASALAGMAVAVATTIGGWLAMAAQAIISAVIIAAQWIIAFWPVALIIAIVAGVIIAIVVFWDKIVAAFKAGAAWVSSAMQTLWGWVKQAWQWVMDKFAAAWQWIVSIFNNIKGAVSAAWNWIIGVFKNAALGIWNAMKQAWSWVVSVWNSIIGFIRRIPGWIVGVFAAAGSWLINAGRNVISGLVNGVSSAVGWIWNGLQNIWHSITGFFSNAGSWLLGAGRAIINGLWNGISSLAGWLWNKVAGWAKSLWNGVLNFFGISSPSKEFHWIGQMLMQGLGGGIDKEAPAAVDSATAAANSVLGAMQDTLSQGAALTATVGTSLSDGAMAALTGTSASIGGSAATAGSGLRPVAGMAGAAALAAQGNAQAQKVVNIDMKTYNPVAEKASDSEARKIRAAAAVGAF